MKFMCYKCKQSLAKNPSRALAAWSKFMIRAREEQAGKQYNEAVITYGNAMDVAQITFENAPISESEVDRYIRTVVEFVYAVRQCDGSYDLTLLVNRVQKILERGLYPANVKLLLKPVQDVASAPLCQVDRWMAKIRFH